MKLAKVFASFALIALFASPEAYEKSERK